MKVTKKYIEKLIKEELQKTLLKESIEQIDPELAQMLQDHPNAQRAAGPDLQWMVDYLRTDVGDDKAMEFVYLMMSGGRGMLQAADEAMQISRSSEDFARDLKAQLKMYTMNKNVSR